MSRFINKQNGRIVTLIEEQKKGDKLLAVSVRFEDDGKETGFSASTWHRWWKEIEEDTPVQEEVPTQEEKVAGDGTPYKEVMQEILQDEKVAAEKKAKKQKEAKKEKKPVQKKAPNENVPEILTFIAKKAKAIKATEYIREKQPNFLNYKTETSKVLFTVHKTSSHVAVFVKASQVPKELMGNLEVLNGFFNRRLVVTELTDDNKVLIENLITALKP